MVLSGFAQVIVDLSAVPIHDIAVEDLRHYDQVGAGGGGGEKVIARTDTRACDQSLAPSGRQVNEQGAINTLGPLEAFGEKSLQQLFAAMMESWGGGAQTAVLKKRGRRFSHSSATDSVDGGAEIGVVSSPMPTTPPPDKARPGRVGFSFADGDDAATAAATAASGALGGRNFFPGAIPAPPPLP